ILVTENDFLGWIASFRVYEPVVVLFGRSNFSRRFCSKVELLTLRNWYSKMFVCIRQSLCCCRWKRFEDMPRKVLGFRSAFFHAFRSPPAFLLKFCVFLVQVFHHPSTGNSRNLHETQFHVIAPASDDKY